MAPAAADTIAQNLIDFDRKADDYDRIITGDLGYVGQSILFDLMRKKGLDIKKIHLDCGMLIYDQQTQDTHAGGSGCGCAAVTLSAYILPKILKEMCIRDRSCMENSMCMTGSSRSRKGICRWE